MCVCMKISIHVYMHICIYVYVYVRKTKCHWASCCRSSTYAPSSGSSARASRSNKSASTSASTSTVFFVCLIRVAARLHVRHRVDGSVQFKIISGVQNLRGLPSLLFFVCLICLNACFVCVLGWLFVMLVFVNGLGTRNQRPRRISSDRLIQIKQRRNYIELCSVNHSN